MIFSLVLNLSEKCHYNLDLVWTNKIQKIFLYVFNIENVFCLLVLPPEATGPWSP